MKGSQGYKRWSKQQEDFLRQHYYSEMSMKTLTEKLGKTERVIKDKVYQLRLNIPKSKLELDSINNPMVSAQILAMMTKKSA